MSKKNRKTNGIAVQVKEMREELADVLGVMDVCKKCGIKSVFDSAEERKKIVEEVGDLYDVAVELMNSLCYWNK